MSEPSRDEQLKLGNQLCFPIYACSRAMIRLYTPLLSRLNLTYPQYLVMLVLWEQDRRSVGEIGRLLHLDSGTLTPLLKRLEKQGLVSRRREDVDERKVIITLTAAGNELKTAALDVPQELFCKSGLTVDEYLTLKPLLTSLLARLEQDAGGDDSASSEG
jgi:MarR family transcriptional regulator, organic hydroperoxide resistance regulator